MDTPTRVSIGDGPLTGIRVLDFSRVLAGPHCGRNLSDLGADVIKIEAPDGDLTRYSYPRVNSIATYFTQQNCGKACVSLDLSRPEGRDVVRRLAAKSDVILENFRGGVMDRLELGHEALGALNPRLVFCSITGFGATGVWAQRRAFALVAQAESGYGWTTTTRIGRPADADPMSHGDMYTALEATIGILAALHQRDRTGVGQWIDVSMTETMFVTNEHLHAELGDDDHHAPGQIISFQPEDYLLVAAADGRFVSVAGHPAEKGTFAVFCAGFDCPELLDDHLFATASDRLEHLDELHTAFAGAAARFPTYDDLERSLDAAGIACGEFRNPRDAASTDWAAERGAIVEVPDRRGGKIRIPNSPWHFSDAMTGVHGEPRYRGEDNRQVLTSVGGYTDAEVSHLESIGILSSRIPTP